MSRLTARFMETFQSTFGYPPGDNTVIVADEETGREARRLLAEAGIDGELPEFYAHIERVALPDVGNGYFVHSARDVADGPRTGQPTELTGARTDKITVFGSDGGGALFAVGGDGTVYRLDGGSLIGTVYEVEDWGLGVVAPDLWGFLRYLRDRVSEEIDPGRA